MPSVPRTALAVVAVVAGQHDDLDAFGRQRLQRVRRRRLDRIGDREDAGKLAIDRDVDRPSRRRRAAVRPARPADRVSMPSDRQEIRIAETARALPSTLPIAPLPVGESKSCSAPDRQIALSRGARRSRRASGCSLARSTLAASRSSSASSNPAAATIATTFGLPSVSVPGLVDDQRVDLLHALQRFGILDQDAGLGAAADADHDRHRRGEAERAGAGDDQDADGRNQAEREPRLRTEQRPGAEGERRRRRSRRARTSRQPGRPGAGSARGERCACATICTICASSVSRPTFSARMTKPPDWLSVPAIDLVAGLLGDRHGLAGHHRLRRATNGLR